MSKQTFEQQVREILERFTNPKNVEPSNGSSYYDFTFLEATAALTRAANAHAAEKLREQAEKDLPFLKEIRHHLTGEFGDRVDHEFVLEMIEDWIAELEASNE